MPMRPPKDWFQRCERGVASKGGALDPRVVCGSVWARKTKKQKESLVRAERRASEENPTGAQTALIVIGVVAGLATVGGVGFWIWKRKSSVPAPAATKMQCPDGTMQTDCTGHMTPSPGPSPNPGPHLHPPLAWIQMGPNDTFQAGKTYRASFTGSVGGVEMMALAPYLAQQGLVTYLTPADAIAAGWPDAADAADMSRVKFQANALTSGVALNIPLALVPSLKVWLGP